MTSPTTRPSPLTDALAKVAPGVSALVALVTGLGSMGLLSATQVAEVASYGDDVTAAVAPTGAIAIAGGAVVGLIAGAAHLIATLKSGKTAEAGTTPLTSPQDHDGTPLVRTDGMPLGTNITTV